MNSQSNSKVNTVLLAAKIRRHIIDMTHRGNSSHVGSGLSISDILAVLYGSCMKIYSHDPHNPNRDRFILSKGHAGAAVYAALAEVGFFDIKLLESHYQNGSKLSGHVSHKEVPGVEFSTGSLGHGLSVGTGIAKAAQLNESKFRTFVLLSDGECDEGSNWEAVLFAAHHNLNSLTAIIDYNKIQSLKSVEETLGLEPFSDKWKAFGWRVIEVDGHNHKDLINTFTPSKEDSEKPTVVICHTTKGKGVSFMENSVLWHYRSPQGDEYKDAVKELNQYISNLEESIDA